MAGVTCVGSDRLMSHGMRMCKEQYIFSSKIHSNHDMTPCREHFQLKRSTIEACCSKWVEDCSGERKCQMIGAAKKVMKGLASVCRKAPVEPDDAPGVDPAGPASGPSRAASFFSQIIDLF